MALGKGLGSLIPQQSRQKSKEEKTSDKIKLKKKKAKEPILKKNDGDKVWHIPLTEICANPEQPRKHFKEEDLADLVASIKKHGVMQPIVVTELANSDYEIIAGERRFRASQIAKMTTIPAIVRKASKQEKLELALIENIQRADLNPIEEAFAYRRLIDEFKLTQEDVSKQVGKSRSTIANIIRLLDLPQEIQKALIAGQISHGKARALLSLKDPDEQLRMFQSMLGKRMNVREVEDQVAKQGAASRKGSVRRDPNLVAQEQVLQDRFGTKVTITQRGDKGKVVIEYYSKEELKKLMEELS